MKRLFHKVRSLAATVRNGRARTKGVRDISTAGMERPQPVMLRERVFKLHLEISRRRALKFLRAHPGGAALVVTILSAAVFAKFFLIGFASTADFYPVSCLGSWDNVAHALGKPDLGQGAPYTDFTALNSAIFSTGTAQMFCGNFSGETAIADLESKNFNSATLVLSWYVALPQPTSSAVTAGGGGGGGAAGDNISQGSATMNIESSTISGGDFGAQGSSTSSSSTSSTAAEAIPLETTSSALQAPTSSNMASSTATSTSVISNATTTATTTDTAIIAATTTATTATTTATTTTTTTAADTNNVTSTSTPVQAPAPEPSSTSAPAPAPAPTTPDTSSTSAPSATSWLSRFLPTAFASDLTSTQAIATGTLDPGTSTALASSVVEGIPATNTPPTALMVNTSPFQNIILPASAPGDFLAIVYSTDGVTWQPLTDINAANAATVRFPLPIASWDALKHLQIAFVGLGAADAPKVYLDAVDVEVSYVDMPEATTVITTSTAPVSTGGSGAPAVSGENASTTEDAATTTPAASSTAVQEPLPAPEIIQPAPVVSGDIFDQGANQKCAVEPFSRTVPRGTSAAFSLELLSGLMTPSSSPSGTIATSTIPHGYQNAQYNTRLGSLPSNVSAYISPKTANGNTSSTQTIRVAVGSAAARGSYSLLVIYRERQDDASLRSTGCQLNLIIP